jgi:hypothetical protein
VEKQDGAKVAERQTRLTADQLYPGSIPGLGLPLASPSAASNSGLLFRRINTPVTAGDDSCMTGVTFGRAGVRSGISQKARKIGRWLKRAVLAFSQVTMQKVYFTGHLLDLQ